MTFPHLLFFIILLPFLGALVNAFWGKRYLREPNAGRVAVLFAAGSFALSVLAVMNLAQMPAAQRGVGIVDRVYPWIYMGRFQIDFSLTLDPLSAVMILVVTGVGTLIHIYAMGYMHGDPLYSRFFVYLNLFLGSMLVLVLGSNFILLYVGWELVGACSYLLIGFWFERVSAAKAGMKAFVVNRVGDYGFAIGIFLTFVAMTMALPPGAPIEMSFRQVSEVVAAGAVPMITVMIICLLLFWGATGKSAQIPLYVWLADAMEGPTPVSALIHAATMVTAGIYMIARTHVLFDYATPTIGGFPVVALIGALTAIFAASIALVQYDIKRVLAYSTISQLGYMFLAVGVGAYVAGIFHLVTHAFFKACLFLGAGSVMHGLHNEVDMRKMGGLKRYMPKTHITFAIATVAIAGIPPLAGFFSKDQILAHAFEHGTSGKILWGIGLVTAFMTSFYMFRMYFRVFWGEPEIAYGQAQGGDPTVPHQNPADHSPDAEGHDVGRHSEAVQAHGHGGGLPHESPGNMTGVLWALAILSVVGGFLLGFPEFISHATGLPFGHLLEGWLVPVFHHGGQTGHEAGHLSLAVELLLMGASIAAALLGLAAAWALYGPAKAPQFRSAQGLERTGFLQGKYYIDELYNAVIVRPGYVLARISDGFDRYVVDMIVNLTAFFVAFWGEVFRFFQSGYLRWYAWGMLGGATILLAWFVFLS
ncbi:MAG: NADH-quinone oxidoreductase subunit L [Armatimonadetes bacterium]|nr:NADH-quinone oxidoreductase subunit L [Armatimonadota bacterium]